MDIFHRAEGIAGMAGRGERRAKPKAARLAQFLINQIISPFDKFSCIHQPLQRFPAHLPIKCSSP